MIAGAPYLGGVPINPKTPGPANQGLHLIIEWTADL
jgi:hypothetical protein